MNPLFNFLGSMSKAKNINIMEIVKRFYADPIGTLKEGFNIPSNMNDSYAIAQHLMNTGQLSQSLYEQARQASQQLGFK